MFALTPEMVLAAGWQDMSKLNPEMEYRYPTFGFAIFLTRELGVKGIREGYSARLFLSLRNECYTEVWTVVPIFDDVFYGVLHSEEDFNNLMSRLIK